MEEGAELERRSRIWKREQNLKKGVEFERGSRILKREQNWKGGTDWKARDSMDGRTKDRKKYKCFHSHFVIPL